MVSSIALLIVKGNPLLFATSRKAGWIRSYRYLFFKYSDWISAAHITSYPCIKDFLWKLKGIHGAPVFLPTSDADEFCKLSGWISAFSYQICFSIVRINSTILGISLFSNSDFLENMFFQDDFGINVIWILCINFISLNEIYCTYNDINMQLNIILQTKWTEQTVHNDNVYKHILKGVCLAICAPKKCASVTSILHITLTCSFKKNAMVKLVLLSEPGSMNISWSG